MSMSSRQDLLAARVGAMFVASLLLPSGLRAGQTTHDHPLPENLGVVSFATSCRPDVHLQPEVGQVGQLFAPKA